jgi:hypothetical protein
MPTPYKQQVRFINYRPSRAAKGQSDGTLWRGQNLVPRGLADPYWENILSKRDTGLSAPSLAVTGTHATTADSNFITGSGTSYTTELVRGDFLIISRRLVRVRRVISNTSFEGSVTWAGSTSGLTAVIPARLRILNELRYTFNRGSLIALPRGHLMGVGAGVVRCEGAVLPGTGLTLSKTPRLALLNAGSFTQFSFGLTVPAPGGFTVSEVAGGTRALPVEPFTIWIAPMRTNPFSYAQAAGPISAPITVAGNKIRISAGPVMDTAKGQDAWMVFVPPVDSPKGPWFYIGTPLTSYPFDFDWYTAEVERNELLEFDNDTPPDAGFITQTLDGRPVLYSCNGENNTTPGPVLRPAKRSNLEAYPVRWSVAAPGDIIGVVSGLGRDDIAGGGGRDYVMTGNGLHIASPTTNPDLPVGLKPFWDIGFYHSDQLVFVNGELYGCTKGGPRRSSSDGVPGSQQYDFAADVGSIFRGWNLEHVVVAEDSKNEAVVFFHPSPEIDPAGRYESEAMMFMLGQQRWASRIVLNDSVADLLVSSAAKASTLTSFIANAKIYEYGNGADPVPWHASTHLINQGGGTSLLAIDNLDVTALTNGGAVGVFGHGDDEEMPSMELDAGNALTGAIPLTDSTTLRESKISKLGINEIRGYGVRVQGTYPGTGELNRVDDIMLRGLATEMP